MPSPSDPSSPFPAVNVLPPPLPPPGAASMMPVTSWDPAMVQWIKDQEHLRLLSIGHYVVGGLALLFSGLFVIYILFGVLILNNSHLFDSKSSPNAFVASPTPAASPDPQDSVDEPVATPAKPAAPTPPSTPSYRRRAANDNLPPKFLGYMMIGIGSVVVLLGWTLGALLIYSGRCLARGTRRVFSMVLACICCLQIPLGTLLGVFTLVVLQRPTVRALYAAHGPGRNPTLAP